MNCTKVVFAIRSIALLATVIAFTSLNADFCQGQSREALTKARKEMVEKFVVGGGIENTSVIEAMTATPRHEFVANYLQDKAYFDMALPIGDKQTISSPFIVAYMTEAIDPQSNDKVLEIGTGSGYQAAVLSPIVSQVYTIEIVEPLGRRAARTLKRLNYDNVKAKVGDGYKGWPEYAPFDKIIVTCSPERVPDPLVEQLAEGGLMVIPVGERYQQTLYLMQKREGKLERVSLRPTLFVPMTGAAEDRRRIQPDPLNPEAVNGRFEEAPGDDGFVPGWYYQRQFTWETSKIAPEGKHFVTFRNEDKGREAHMIQGFPIDGREIPQLKLSATVKYSELGPGRSPGDLPAVAISFYDKDRRDLGYVMLGPFRGSQDWDRVSKTVRVPPRAREGILRIGLFGATGEISFDHVTIVPVDE